MMDDQVPEEHARMAKALLTGINRAFPFASGAGDELKNLLLGFAEPLLKMCSPSVAFPTTLQALNLLSTLSPFDPVLRARVINAFQGILDEQDRLRQASASHSLFLRSLARTCTLLIEINDRASLQRLLKSLLRFALAIVSPAFLVASLALLGNLLHRFPGLKLMINSAPESLQVASEEGFYELVALSRHYHPRVKRYAQAILSSCQLPRAGESPSSLQILADPFEKLSLLSLLEVWNRMRRTTKKNNTSKLEGDVDEDDDNLESDPDEDEKIVSIKKTDNAQVAAALYELEEYNFISKYINLKDKLNSNNNKNKKPVKNGNRSDGSSCDDDDDDIAGVDEDPELEAEADEIMNQAIKNHINSAFGDEEEDDEFAYSNNEESEEEFESVLEEDEELESGLEEDEEELESGLEDEEEIGPNGVSDSNPEDNSDFDAMFVDSDAEFIPKSDFEEEEDEIIEPVSSKKPKLQSNSNDKKHKKQKKKSSVFANASDYEDALLD